jgi:hypothetical protein
MSLAHICIAFAATAKNEYKNPKLGDAQGFKKFVMENIAIITKMSFGVTCTGDIRLGNIFLDDPEKKIGKGKPDISISDILYEVRCNVLHEAELPQKISFTDECKIVFGEKSIVLPISLVYGLIMAVVGAKSNMCKTVLQDLNVNLGSKNISLNSLWGQKKKIEQYLQEG